MARSWKFLLSALMAGLVLGACAGVLVLQRRVTEGQTQLEQSSIFVPKQEQALGGDRTQGVDLPSSVDDDFIQKAFENKEDWRIENGTRVLLVPHHLVAAREIASLLSSTPKPSKVILVVPDHFSSCPAVSCSTDAAFGEFVSPTSSVLSKEHAVTGLAPFMQKAWGGVGIVPVLVSPEAPEEKMSALIGEIERMLQADERALLVASIDASHYLPAEVADFHDELTEDVIVSLADREVGRAEIDAPAVLRVALKTARDLGLGDAMVHAHTNSLRLMQTKVLQESTSHFLVSFSPGKIRRQEKVTMMFLGDMMFDRNVADRSKGDLLYPFRDIVGQENRFFRGQDLLIGNLEGPVTDKRLPPDKGNVDFMFNLGLPDALKRLGLDAVSQANNHTWDQGEAQAAASIANLQKAGVATFGDQIDEDGSHSASILERRGHKIAMVGFNTTDNPLDLKEAEAALSAARSKSDYLVVFMHWGEEYAERPNGRQVELAHWLIDHGADAVIGSHPHWMQSVETYRGRMIAYSLGNFIFDQDWSEETKYGLAAGLVLDGKESRLYLYPIRIEKSRPHLLTAAEKDKRLELLSSVSDEGLSGQIKDGVISSVVE